MHSALVPNNVCYVPQSDIRRQLAEAHTEPIGLSPCDAADTGGSKIIEAQFKRFSCVNRGCETKAGTIARQVTHCAINQ